MDFSYYIMDEEVYADMKMTFQPKHCYRKGFIANYRPIANYEYHTVVSRGHTVGANVHWQSWMWSRNRE